MTTLRETSPDLPAHPLDLVEDIVTANEWPFDRASDDELVAELRGRCCDYRLFFVWRDDVSALHFSCAFDAKVPETRRREIYTLIGMINERLWIGHIEIGQEDGMPLFRHTLPLRGLLTGASLEQLEDLVDAAFTECERFFPAFQLVIWGGKSAAEALEVALFDTLGEA